MHVVIVGNGISGITAARWLRKLNDGTKITVISSESKFFYSRTALMYMYMGHMTLENTQPYEDWFWEKNRIDLLQDHVNSIDFNNKTLSLKAGGNFGYDKLILALGSKSNKFGWPGQDLNKVGGLYHLQDLVQMEKHSKGLKRAVICGGGLIGIEMAEMFHSRHIDVTMLVREGNYWDNVLPSEEATMISNHIKSRHIDLRLGVNLGEIVDDGSGNACAVIVKESGERIDCGYVGLTAGVSPNVGWLKETELNVNRGIVVDEYLQTNIPDVYAIGDCSEHSNPRPGRRPIEAIWYTGRMMGETVAYNISGKQVAYDPGIWFNSAKFIDIEYQVYGDVLARPPENHASIIWQDNTAEKSVRIVYDKNDHTIVGFNLFGVRYRHEVCEKWLAEKTPVEEVLQNLELAHFDPEFYKSYADDVIGTYNKATGKSLKLKKMSGLNKVLKFLRA